MKKKLREMEIRRNILLVFSYCDLFLGAIDLMIAFVMNHDGIASNDTMVPLYLIIGIVVMGIGKGGIYYEGILRTREDSLRRNVHLFG